MVDKLDLSSSMTVKRVPTYDGETPSYGTFNKKFVFQVLVGNYNMFKVHFDTPLGGYRYFVY